MILRRFGTYLLQKRFHANWVVFVCAILPFFRVPTEAIAIMIVALVTLHKGVKEGFWVLCWAALPALAVAFSYTGVLPVVLPGVIIVWVLAGVLARSESWTRTVIVLMVIGVIVDVIVHLIMPGVDGWWLQHIGGLWNQFPQVASLHLTPEQSQQMLRLVARLVTSSIIAIFLVLEVAFLAAARSWQALLFNPGGLAKEWVRLYLNYPYALVFLLVLFTVPWYVPALVDLVPILLVGFLLVGLSLIHAKLTPKQPARSLVLIGLYLTLIAFAHIAAFLIAFLGVVDSFVDFRGLRKVAIK